MMVTASESVTKKGIHVLSSLGQSVEKCTLIFFFGVESLRTVSKFNRDLGKFIVVFFVKFHTLHIVVQWHNRNEQKSVMHMQSVQVLLVMDPTLVILVNSKLVTFCWLWF